MHVKGRYAQECFRENVEETQKTQPQISRCLIGAERVRATSWDAFSLGERGFGWVWSYKYMSFYWVYNKLDGTYKGRNPQGIHECLWHTWHRFERIHLINTSQNDWRGEACVCVCRCRHFQATWEISEATNITRVHKKKKLQIKFIASFFSWNQDISLVQWTLWTWTVW